MHINLKCTSFFYICHLGCDSVELTFFKFSRLHAILPKHFNVTVCCAFVMTIGSICCNSSGNKYHLNWSIFLMNPSKPLQYLCPISHIIANMSNAQHNSMIDIQNTNKLFPLSDYDVSRKKIREKNTESILKVCKYSTI